MSLKPLIPTMKLILSFLLALLLLLAGCTPNQNQSGSQGTMSLAEARRGFKTSLTPQKLAKEPAEPAPTNIFRSIQYPAPPGNLVAYLSPDPKDGTKHPAIIWITGGDCNSIGDVWSPAPRENDQTAAVFRKAGIISRCP